jgi:hypothetical protein
MLAWAVVLPTPRLVPERRRSWPPRLPRTPPLAAELSIASMNGLPLVLCVVSYMLRGFGGLVGRGADGPPQDKPN